MSIVKKKRGLNRTLHAVKKIGICMFFLCLLLHILLFFILHLCTECKLHFDGFHLKKVF